MILKFSVTGRNKKEIKERADEIIAGFLEAPTPGDTKAHFEVMPLASTAHGHQPVIWQGDVTAEI